MIVAIDGPAGSGKSSVSRLVALHTGLVYIDSGALYRSVAYATLNSQSLGDARGTTCNAAEVAQNIVVSFGAIEPHTLQQQVLLDRHDVTHAIRTPEIDEQASIVAQNAEVRDILTKKMHAMAKESNCIVEGRDIATVVFPHADLKIFLDASAEQRAQRRFKQSSSHVNEKALSNNGEKMDVRAATSGDGNATDDERLKQLRISIKERDRLDKTRDVAPLVTADDAIVIETDDLDQNAVAAIIIDRINDLMCASERN